MIFLLEWAETTVLKSFSHSFKLFLRFTPLSSVIAIIGSEPEQYAEPELKSWHLIPQLTADFETHRLFHTQIANFNHFKEKISSVQC